MPSMMVHTSTYLTVLLAWHRFCAALQPVEYFMKWKFINPTGYLFLLSRNSSKRLL
jgi:hypothetical protein